MFKFPGNLKKHVFTIVRGGGDLNTPTAYCKYKGESLLKLINNNQSSKPPINTSSVVEHIEHN